MDLRKFRHILQRAQWNECHAAAMEILEEINEMIIRHGDHKFCWYDAELKRLQNQVLMADRAPWLRIWNLIDKIGELVFEGCLPEPEDCERIEKLRLTKLEASVARALHKEGFHVLRNGWPDFLAVQGKRIIGVEVKCAKDKVSPQQRMMHAALKRAGIQVMIVRQPTTMTRQINRVAS
jgi:hypothetical protein